MMHKMKKKVLYCRKCKKVLETLRIGGFDAFVFPPTPQMMYCDNKKCKWYGVVVVAGLKNLNN